jgi:alpha-mannosidase
VDFNDGRRGVTVATPENPMVQFGDFHFGDNQYHFELERAMLLGWVTNTYWETNFRAYQPGLVTARYRVRPYGGTFDEGAAHRLGLEAANDAPLLQQLGEPHGELRLPLAGSLLALPEPPVMVIHVKPAYSGSGALVRLLNASDEAQNATIGSGLVQIGQAVRCDLLENELGPLPVENGAVQLTLQPREMAAVLIRA